MHCGTNDLRQESIQPKQIAENIVNLQIAATSLATKENEVIISGICPRGDYLNEKAFEVNEYLGGICNSRNIGFISNHKIQPEMHLNNSKLHLNKRGDEILARNFRHAIKRY